MASTRNRFGAPVIPIGWPDFTFAVKGHAVAWECKQDNDHPRYQLNPDQADMRDALLANGWTYAVVRSFDQAQQTLADLQGRAWA